MKELGPRYCCISFSDRYLVINSAWSWIIKFSWLLYVLTKVLREPTCLWWDKENHLEKCNSVHLSSHCDILHSMHEIVDFFSIMNSLYGFNISFVILSAAGVFLLCWLLFQELEYPDWQQCNFSDSVQQVSVPNFVIFH